MTNEHFEELKADVEFENSRNRFILSLDFKKEEKNLEPMLDDAWDKKYNRELNLRHNKRLKHEANKTI